ncbi:hypothetical protein V1521DRAFT_444193 [Lipomyces starkeyi]
MSVVGSNQNVHVRLDIKNQVDLQIPRYRRPYAYGDPKHSRANQTPLRLVAKGKQPERRQLKMRTNSLPNSQHHLQMEVQVTAGFSSCWEMVRFVTWSCVHFDGEAHLSRIEQVGRAGPLGGRASHEQMLLFVWRGDGKAVLVKRPQETRQAQSKGCLNRALRKATLAASFAAKHGLPDPPPAAAPPPPRADATHPAVRDGGRHVARTRFRTGNAFPSPSNAGAYDRRQLLTPWVSSAVADAVAESRQDGPGYLCRQVRQQDGSPAPKSKRVAVAPSSVRPKPKRNPRIKRKADAECEDAIVAPDAAAIVTPSKSKRCKLTSS